MSNTTEPCPNHHFHNYNFPELSLGTGSNQQPYFRALIFFYKKPGLTDDFFHEHWKSVHADLTISTMMDGACSGTDEDGKEKVNKNGEGVTMVRYVQVRFTAPCSRTLGLDLGRLQC
jgi:hypothetical protein